MKKIIPALVLLVLFVPLFPQDFPQRIVSLVPASTEILFAVGAGKQVAARTDFCTFPPEAAELPSVGGFDGKAVSLERIVAFRPDMVCLAGGMHDHLVKPLERLGIRVFVSSAESIAGVLAEMERLAGLAGKKKQGEACVETIESQLEQARKIAAHPGKAPPRVYWEVSASPYFTCGAKSFVSDLLGSVGAENIFSDVAQAYPQVSEESIIARRPDIIIFPDYAKTGGTADFRKRRNWQRLPAVAGGRIFPVDPDLFSRPGPRVGQMALELARILAECAETGGSGAAGTAR